MAFDLIQRLRSLRSRLRRLFFFAGALRLLAESAGAVIVFYLLDRSLLLPMGARLVLTLLLAILFVIRLRELVYYPQRRTIRSLDLAMAVERHSPEFKGSLASAVELGRRRDRLPQDVSPDLVDAFLERVSAESSKVRFEEVLSYRRLKQLLALDGVLATLLVAWLAFNPAESKIFFQRMFGSSMSWPRATYLTLDVATDSPHFRVDRDEQGQPVRVLIARGGSLPITVTAEGTVPEEVLLVVDEEGVSRAEEELPMLPREDRPEVFQYRFRNVLRPMVLYATGGDDRGDQVVKIDVSPPPGVERLVATIQPPAYTRLPEITEERSEFSVPAGTTLRLAVDTFGETSKVTLTFHNDPSTEVALVPDSDQSGRFLHTFQVVESGTFNLHLVSEAGFKNLAALDYGVTALPDRNPTVDVARPGVTNLEVTARGVIPFRLLADDDFGLTSVDLLLSRLGDETPGEEVSLLAPGQDLTPVLGEPINLVHVLDLLTFRLARGEDRLALQQGETLIYRVRALDNRRNFTGETDPGEFLTSERRVDVVDEDEKIRKLSDRQLRLKQTVRKLHDDQQERRASLAAFLGGEVQNVLEEDSRALAALEVEQNRISNRARQVSKDFAEIVEEYLVNRLDASPSADRVLNEFLATSLASESWLRFDPVPYRGLVQDWSDGKFGQLDLLGNLLGMLDLALQASEELAVQALEALREARVTSDAGRMSEQLANALDLQGRLAEIYAQLLKKMEEWEDFQEVIDLFRRLYRDQELINQRTRDSGK